MTLENYIKANKIQKEIYSTEKLLNSFMQLQCPDEGEIIEIGGLSFVLNKVHLGQFIEFLIESKKKELVNLKKEFEEL